RDNTTIGTNIRAVWNVLAFVTIRLPRPEIAVKNSATITPTSPRPIASLTPVNTYGSDAGMSRSRQTRCSGEQNERVTSRSSESTSSTPRVVLITTGKNTKNATTKILALSPKTNHSTITGTSATAGSA